MNKRALLCAALYFALICAMTRYAPADPTGVARLQYTEHPR